MVSYTLGPSIHSEPVYIDGTILNINTPCKMKIIVIVTCNFVVTRFLVYEHVILYMCKMQSYFTSFQGPTTMFAKINLGYKLALMANNSLIINKIILMT